MLSVPGIISPGLKWRGVHLTIQPHQMLRIRMRGAITLFRPYILSWLVQKYPRIQKMRENTVDEAI
jgi:hypothetical protein